MKNKIISLTFSMTWGYVSSVVEDMARYAHASATVSSDGETVTLMSREGIGPIVIERAKSFGWEIAQCSPTFKQKQIVMIYEDPYTCQKPEGDARIIKHLTELAPGVDLYLVHFIGDQPSQNVERIIQSNDNL